jgi:gamma-glutamyltranspeptidase/glutathione hydrolase
MLETHRGETRSPLRAERSCALARGGMVCSSVPRASAAGRDVLARGGNAIDAALATAAMLCVVEPMSTGIGGDAFALLWSAPEQRLLGLNGSGRAPSAATLETYRARGLEHIPTRGILAATVPGAVHAWESLSRRLGRLPLADVLAPAIRAAEEGFAVTELVAHYWFWLHRSGVLDEAAAGVWAPEGRTPRAGEWFRVPALAATLRGVAEGGAEAFYRGPIAEAIVTASRAAGGFFCEEDLASHDSSWVEPITTTYRDTTVAELPPNGQGLAALIGLNILEQLDPAEAPATSALDWHRRIEAIKLAFADRNAHIADPEHSDVPVAALLDKTYAKERAREIGDRALPGGPGPRRGCTGVTPSTSAPPTPRGTWCRSSRASSPASARESAAATPASCSRAEARASVSARATRTPWRRGSGRSTRSFRACSSTTTSRAPPSG